MSAHAWSERLSEYVDGDLESRDVTALEQHVTECRECRQAVVELRRVRAWLRATPADRADAPTAQRWTAIERRIAAGAKKPRRMGITVAVLAAAAVLVLMIWPRGTPPSDGGRVMPVVPIAAPASVYEKASHDLETLLRDNRERLRPETVRALERSIAMIDSAITQAEQALAADPANDYVIRYLNRLRANRLATLREAAILVQL